MTSRGNQSVSPPAQISQQRHVNLISSNTPPPQQYFQGSSPALPQGAYEFLPQAQSQAYLPYQTVQAYGSAINDIRGQPGNNGRAGPLQQGLPQGGSYYQQHSSNMRPQQLQQAPAASQQYYISPQAPNTYCQPRPAQPSSQQMLYYPNFPSGSNVYIPANMIQGPTPTVPMYQQAQFMPSPTYQTGMMCYPNGTQWRNPNMAPAGAPYVRQQAREKKVLSITDPDTGRNITEEIFSHRPHPTDSDDPYEQAPTVNQNNIEIRQSFTRMVADRLKSPDEPSLIGSLPDSQGAIGGAPTPSSQQYQQLPPQQQMQQQPASKGPAPMMRPPLNGPPPAMSHQMMPPRPGSSQQQPPVCVTPPQDIQQHLGVNLSIPPPQLPVRSNNQAVYSPTPQQAQHSAHPVPHHPQTPPQQQQQQQQQPQPVRQHMAPAMPTPLQQVQLQSQQSPHHLPSHQPLLNQVLPHAPQNQSPQYSQMSAASVAISPAAQQIPSSGMVVNPAAQHIPSSMAVNPAAQQQIPSGMAVNPAAQQQIPSSMAVNPAAQQQIPSGMAVNPAAQQYIPSSMAVNPAAQQQIPSGMVVNPAAQQIPSSMAVNPAAQQQIPPGMAVNPATQQIPLGMAVNPATQQIPSGMAVNPATQQIPPGMVVNPATQQIPFGMAVNPAAALPVNQIDFEKPKQQVEIAPQNNIPAKLTGPPVSSPVAKTAPPVKELSPAQQTEPVRDVKSPPPTKMVPSFRDEQTAEKIEDSSKEEPSQGANSQGVKDGRKGKKGWKGVNRKDGSDMDAFIDNVNETNSEAGDNNKPSAHNTQETSADTAVNGASGQEPPVRQASFEERETKQASDASKGSEITNARNRQKASTPPQKDSTPAQKDSAPAQKDSTPAQKDSASTQKDSASTQKDSTSTQKDSASTQKDSASTQKDRTPTPESSGAVTLDNGYSKDKDSSHTVKHQDSQKSATAAPQTESKYKQKKKKKKGHHSPPNQKSKQSSPSNDTSEKQGNAVETDSKSAVPSSATDNKDSKGEVTAPQDSPVALQDTPAVQDAKAQPTSLPTSEPATVADIEQSPSDASPSPQKQEAVKDQTHTASSQESNFIKEAPPTTNSVISVSKLDSSKNQNLKTPELSGDSSTLISEHLNQPLDISVKEESSTESVQINDSSVSDSSSVNHRISEENESQEWIVKPDASGRKEQVSDADSEGVSLRPSSERTVSRGRKDGRLQYDSAYLLELRDCPSSQAKPKGLPDLPEIILELPLVSASRRTNTAPLDFTPAFFQPSGSMRNAPPIGSTNSRNRQRPDLMMPQRIIKSVSLQDSVKALHQSEKPWKPTPKQLSAGEIVEKTKTLESEVLFIMNRLTPTNFERLAEEMKSLNIKTYEDLQELIRIFFDKVTIETKFVEAYAKLCKVMSSLKVPPPPNSNVKESQATFRVVMLTKCQQEFEADKTSIFEDPEEKRKKMEAEMPEGPEKHAKIDATLYQMKMKRLKFYGNIRFIGELFKLGMLTENIMHDCIYRLLKARDDDSLLSLCNLISTVGQSLDTDKARTRMDHYFLQMAKISDERKSRIKFTLKDIIDLRSNNWIPRKEQTGPKKIDEVHKDFQQEQATKQFLQSQPPPPRTESTQPSNRRGGRPRQDEKQVSGDDGWNTVGSKVQRIDASKMRLSKNVVDENSIQLGPGGGMKQLWTRGSFGGAQPAQDNERPAANRFSALRGEEDRRSYQRSPSRGDSGAAPGRGTRQGPTAGHGRGKILPRSSQEEDRRDGGRPMHGGRSQNSSRDNSWNREDRRQPVAARGSREDENPMTRSTGSLRPSDSFISPAVVSSSLAAAAGGSDGQAVKKVKPLSEEEMEHKAKTILEEYLSAMDLDEAKLCVKELEGQTHISLLVTTSINGVMEKTYRERDRTGSFFHEIVKHGLFSLDMYLKGLSEVLSSAEDMVIDIPKIWTYLAQIIVPMLVGGSLTWPTLSTTLKSNLDRKCCAKLVAEILLMAKEKTSEREVAQMWQASNMNWTTFLDAEEVTHFLKDKKLHFTMEAVAGTSSQVNVQRFMEDVENIIRRNGTNDEIFACIDKYAGSDMHDKHFIRSVVTAVVNASISPTTKKLNEEVLKSRKVVLQRYIWNKSDMELQALYAIQALMHKLEHPSGVIASIFDTLYDEEVISEETFKQWEKSTDPQEAEGKGACSMQLTQFFTWLRENEEPETS